MRAGKGGAVNSEERQRLLRAVEGLPAYPAVLMPRTGGFEVIFPNLPRTRAFGVNRDQAEANARDILTAELGGLVKEGRTPPKASDPEALIADDDDPPGTEMVIISPDRHLLRARLGLEKRERGLDMGMGRLGKTK